MDNKGNFRRGSVELLVLYLLNQRDFYGYELSLTIKQNTDGIIDIPVGSLYPALYKLIDKGYITDYKRQTGKRQIRVYYHIEETGRKRLERLMEDYRTTSHAITSMLSYKAVDSEETHSEDE